MLDGTQFVGRHSIEAALAAGHEVSLLHRGKTNPDLFPTAHHIIADRRESLRKLESNEWDVCIDANAYIPREVEMSADVLASRVSTYIFVSTVSVYDAAKSKTISENAPLLPPVTDTEEVNAETYGGLKVACEEIVTNTFPGQSVIVRPGYIIGPHDPTYRFPYWIDRARQGQPLVVPSPSDVPLQMVDARDLAQLLLSLTHTFQDSVMNAVGPAITFKDFIEATVAEFPTDVHHLPLDWLTERGYGLGEKFPLFGGSSARSLMTVDPKIAVKHGLRHRPLADTIRDTAHWLTTGEVKRRGNPLDSDQIDALLREWES